MAMPRYGVPTRGVLPVHAIMASVDEEFVEAVLTVVESIPPGRAMAYGDIAEIVGARLGRGGPRQVGAVLATYGGGVPWWRVVTAAGRPPRRSEVRALREFAAEGTPLRSDGVNVDLRRAGWHPAVSRDEPDDPPGAGDRHDRVRGS
jgi:alkylated DNA nucleotide flippase Atl1